MAYIQAVPFGLSKSKLAVVDDTIVFIRLKTIYRLLKQQDYAKSLTHIILLIDTLKKTECIRMTREMYNTVLNTLMHMRINLALRKYSLVHNALRDLQILNITKDKESQPEYKLFW